MSNKPKSQSQQGRSWRDVLPIHPAAELFPLMSPDELRALGEDIAKIGLTQPIIFWREHEVSKLDTPEFHRLMKLSEALSRDDIGANSGGEVERLRVCVENLQAEKRRFETKVAGLEREVEDLKAALHQGPPIDESPEEYWQRSLTALADEVIVRTTFHWPDNWKNFDVPLSLLDNATRAMTAWCDLVKQLSTQVARPGDMPPIPGFLDRTKQKAALWPSTLPRACKPRTAALIGGSLKSTTQQPRCEPVRRCTLPTGRARAGRSQPEPRSPMQLHA